VGGDGGEAPARAVADELRRRLGAFLCERVCGREDLVTGDPGPLHLGLKRRVVAREDRLRLTGCGSPPDPRGRGLVGYPSVGMREAVGNPAVWRSDALWRRV
jgi:hypothetical protein